MPKIPFSKLCKYLARYTDIKFIVTHSYTYRSQKISEIYEWNAAKKKVLRVDTFLVSSFWKQKKTWSMHKEIFEYRANVLLLVVLWSADWFVDFARVAIWINIIFIGFCMNIPHTAHAHAVSSIPSEIFEFRWERRERTKTKGMRNI